MRAGTCPRWTNTSPTTLRVCSFAYGPGVDRRDCPPHPSPTRHLAGQGMAASPGRLARAPGPPAEFAKEAVMQIRTAVVVCVGLIVTDRAPEPFAAPPPHPLARNPREPLAPGSTAATMLTGAPGIDLDRDHSLLVGFRPGVLIDLAPKLVRLPAVHPPRLGAASGSGWQPLLR